MVGSGMEGELLKRLSGRRERMMELWMRRTWMRGAEQPCEESEQRLLCDFGRRELRMDGERMQREYWQPRTRPTTRKLEGMGEKEEGKAAWTDEEAAGELEWEEE